MDNQKQFETMAALRAYADRMLRAEPTDCRPSVAKYNYADVVKRMAELVKQLDTQS